MVPRNTKEGARHNISAHYDLGNDLFASFLDERLMYSSAYYPSPDASLEDAQTEKLDRLCRQLKLEPDDHLVEIGTGWGGMAIYAASEYGCRVTTTTISKEQHAYASEWVAEEGLSDQITVLDQDYRDLRGKFSKLVSIEMIEAVGWQYFKTFFRKCSDLLADDGLMALQAIVIDDDLYEVEKASKSFANTVVFPGGCLPSERVIDELVTHKTDMSVRWVDDITPHYSETLREWRRALRGGVAAASRHRATTSASGACGRSTSPSPRAASASGGSATSRWCSPSRDSPRPRCANRHSLQSPHEPQLREGRRGPAAGPDPRAGREPRELGAGDGPARGRARRDRGGHARLRRLGPPARGDAPLSAWRWGGR